MPPSTVDQTKKVHLKHLYLFNELLVELPKTCYRNETNNLVDVGASQASGQRELPYLLEVARAQSLICEIEPFRKYYFRELY